jgi:ABC-type Fe3+ transport system substrate-binding protein
MSPMLTRPSVARLVVVAALASLTPWCVGCEPRQPVSVPSAPPVDRLVIVTPHNEATRTVFEDAFFDWHQEQYGGYIAIEWVAYGTPQCVRFVREAGRPDFIPAGRPIPDVFFGGGPLDHDIIAEMGLSLPVDLEDVEAQLPAEIAGIKTRDAQTRWHASALAGFGLLVAQRACDLRDIEPPASWADLGDPRFYSWLSVADPERSGSNRQCLLLILQKYGWDEGWGIIMRIAANSRALAASSTDVIRNVVSGNCLAGFCVNFNALRQVELHGAAVAYVVPQDASTISADPVSVLTYAQHPTIGKRFVQFCLSDAGQAAWGYKAEHRGGRGNTLFRYPIHPAIYTEHQAELSVTDNPYESASIVPLVAELERQRSRIVGPLLLAACGDNHIRLQQCWRQVIDAGMPQAALDELLKPVMSESEAYKLGDQYHADRDAAVALFQDWAERFRQKYARVESLLSGS